MRILILFSLLLFSTHSFASDSVEKSSAKAFNSKGQLVYIEKHEIVKKENNLIKLNTRYFTPQGIYIGKIESDFSQNPLTPIYISEDIRFDRTDGIRLENKEWVAFAKKDQNSKTKEMKFKIEEDLVAGQGLHYFLQANINSLLKEDKPHKVKFLVPMNQDTYNFQIKVLKKTDNLVTFRVEFDSWFLRMIAPHIDTTYEISTGRLISYEGPSNLLSNDKETQNVVINYSYDSETVSINIAEENKDTKESHQ